MNFDHLNLSQMNIVTDGLQQAAQTNAVPPAVTPKIFHLGDLTEEQVTEEQATVTALSARAPDRDSPEFDELGIAGWCAVYRSEGRWWGAQMTREGISTSSHAFDGRQGAVDAILRQVRVATAYWMTKVRWRELGVAPGRHRDRDAPVIRCEHEHYTLGPEPGQHGVQHWMGALGHGGRQFAFRYIATGERIQSRNVWSQGRIPLEFRDLLPDNATREQSDEELGSAATHRQLDDCIRRLRERRDAS
jgi:hypothetical protein